MSRKFSITQTIDFNKLNNELEKYTMLNGYDPYLFMGKDTINAILNECPTTDGILEHYNQIRAKVNGVAGYYCGCKVFEDNTLKFGEVEIR